MDNTKILATLLVVLALIATALGIGQYNNTKDIKARLDRPVPTPENITIGQSQNPEYQNLIGTWSGVWSRNNPDLAMNGTLIVKSIDENNVASVVYAWGSNERIGITEGYVETIAEIEGRLIDVKMRHPTDLYFVMEDNSAIGIGTELKGFFDNQYASAAGLLTKSNQGGN